MLRVTENLGESAVQPSAVLVYNPLTANSLGGLDKIDNQKELEGKYLFRSRPNIDQFYIDHLEFVKLLRQKFKNVILIPDILDDELDDYYCLLRKNPNQIYTRDAAITIPWVKNGVIIGNMKKDIRKTESQTMRRVFKKLNMDEIVKLPKTLFLEGGDVIPFCYEGKKVLLIGFGQRTEYETIQYLAKNLIGEYIDEIIGIYLAEWRINLDGGMVPVADNVLLAHTHSLKSGFIFNKNGQKDINPLCFFESIGYHIIECGKDESIYEQSCNALCVGSREIITYDLSPRIQLLLEEEEVIVHTCKGEELVKGTGGPRCMTRPIYLDSL